MKNNQFIIYQTEDGKVKIEKYSDGSVILTPIEITSAFEFNLMKDQMFQKRLAEFGVWESDNQL